MIDVLNVIESLLFKKKYSIKFKNKYSFKNELKKFTLLYFLCCANDFACFFAIRQE